MQRYLLLQLKKKLIKELRRPWWFRTSQKKRPIPDLRNDEELGNFVSFTSFGHWICIMISDQVRKRGQFMIWGMKKNRGILFVSLHLVTEFAKVVIWAICFTSIGPEININQANEVGCLVLKVGQGIVWYFLRLRLILLASSRKYNPILGCIWDRANEAIFSLMSAQDSAPRNEGKQTQVMLNLPKELALQCSSRAKSSRSSPTEGNQTCS